MSDNGWISLHRKIKDHWLWKDPVKFKWWIDILLTVNHADNKVNLGNKLFECKRGQSVKSLKTWAEQFKTTKDNVRNFFKLLEKDNMILLENVVKSTRLTVCNYDSYQHDLHATQTQHKRTHYTNNNDNKDNNISMEGKPSLTDKEGKFLTLFNQICKRQFLTLNDKAKRQFQKLIKKQFTGANFVTSITNGYADSLLWPDPSKYTPEYATREAEFEKYLYAIKKSELVREEIKPAITAEQAEQLNGKVNKNFKPLYT